MSETDIVEEVLQIICENTGAHRERIALDATLADIGADSLDSVEIVMALEDTFHIQVPDEKAHDFKTVGDVVKFTKQAMGI